jgi:hypothetical protein
MSALLAPSRFEKEHSVMHVQNDDQPRGAGGRESGP